MHSAYDNLAWEIITTNGGFGLWHYKPVFGCMRLCAKLRPRSATPVPAFIRSNISRKATNSFFQMLRWATSQKRVSFLHYFEGLIEDGELLLVLGPPGSGCSTLLKSLSGRTAGLHVGSELSIDYRGVS